MSKAAESLAVKLRAISDDDVAAIDEAVAPLVEALEKNADALRKCLTGGEIATYEASFRLADAEQALEPWRQK